MDIDAQKIESILRHVAATEILPRFRNLQQGDIREKNPNDFVTIADEESERALTKLLTEALPGSLVVGEEAVAKDKTVLERFNSGQPVWVVDPIDGTYNFMNGRSTFGILLALVKDGVTQYGWAYDVPGNRVAFARKGHGSSIDGKPFKIVPTKADMKDMTGQGGGGQAWHFDPIRPYFKDIINLRCSLYDFMNFYTGVSDFIVHLNQVKPWDHAAGIMIAQEAGAYVALEKDETYHPSMLKRTFLVAAPTKEWRDRLYPVLHDALVRKTA